jgi:GTPase
VPTPFRSGFVALVGRANVGKSTLLNAFVGEKVAIVSPHPQTTRRRILGIRTTPTEQVIFVDTPGIHRPRTELGRYMVDVARRAIPDADVAVWVVDVSAPPTDVDRTIAGLLRQSARPIVVAMNKSDRLPPQHVLERTDAFRTLSGADAWTLTVATDGHNLDRLWAMIVEHLPEGPCYYPEDQLTDQTDRMLVAELVREAALRFLQQEVPHGVEVVVTGWQERSDGLLELAASIVVERASHKGIVIGRGGAMLGRIGTAARHEIERLLGRHIFLALEVHTRQGWRHNAGELRRLGFE